MFGKFWWGHTENNRKISWMAWSGLGRNKKLGCLGYRELESFNLSMLAKQGWRFSKFPRTLAVRVMREKYSPTSDFLGSSLGCRPSFAWRSIWNSKHVLQEGLLWRIGDGTQVKIWRDRWIPSTNSHIIQSPSHVLRHDAKVCEIIDADTKWWNIPLIEQIFPVEIVEQICSIPISPLEMQDRLVWAGTSTRHFSVRSTYHLEREQQARLLGSCSDSSLSSSMWTFIWTLQIPRSAQLFIWRACNEILPTKEKLHKRRVVDDPLCPMCKQVVESSYHALWGCSAARAIWTEGPRRISKCNFFTVDVLSLFGQLIDRLDRAEVELFVMVGQ